MKARSLSLFVVAISIVSSSASAADWAQWRGPKRDGVSQEKGLADEWPQAGPKLLWQVKSIGDGYGAPAVVGGRIYLIGNNGMENEVVQALNPTNGQQIWQRRLGKVGNPDQEPPYPAARSTPTVDGNLLYAFGSDGDLACLDAGTGAVRWQKNVRQEFGGKPGVWAYAESPLVDGNVVVCSPGGPDATIVALNKTTGDVIWKGQVPEGDEAGYASAIVVDAGGKKQYVQFLGKGVVGVDAATGSFLWRYNATGGGPANIATPVAQDGNVYTPSQAGSGLVRLSPNGGVIEAQQVYLTRGLPNSIGGSVLIDGHLYGTTRVANTFTGLVCADFKTGEVKWKDPSIGVGAVCSADGLLFVHSENGEVALVEATPTAYREKGRITLPEKPQHASQQEKSWAYPVVANGRLYIRDKNVLWCYGIADTASPN